MDFVLIVAVFQYGAFVTADRCLCNAPLHISEKYISLFHFASHAREYLIPSHEGTKTERRTERESAELREGTGGNAQAFKPGN